MRSLSEPNPVLGTDGKVHLAYELLVANPGPGFITIDTLDVVDQSGAVLASLSGDALSRMSHYFHGSGNTLSPGGVGDIWLDVTVDGKGPVPTGVATRMSITRQSADKDGKPAPFPAGQPVPAKATFTTAGTAVGKPARIIEPPLRGERWIAANGCCHAITSHRGALMSINGRLVAPERFANDWIQLDANDRMVSGDPSKLRNYAYYGAPVYSVADGVVVNEYDLSDEQIPAAEPTGITPESIGGNMLVIDIGGGAYAFYAHLQRGSLKAKLGDRVKAGQVIGLVGNTGNSSGPHLHFHLMDGTSPLNANGLPFVFSRFTVRGRVKDGQDDSLLQGKTVDIETPASAAVHTNELPLDNEVVDFTP